MKKIAIAAVLSALVAAPAIAADAYVGAIIGTNSMNYSNVKSSTAYGILGGYKFNKNIAAEAAYIDFGSADMNATTTKATGNVMSIAAVGSLPLNKDFSLFAKLGFASSSIKSGATQDNTDLTYGAGALYNATKTVGVRLGYDVYRVGKTNTADSTLITIGAVYNF